MLCWKAYSLATNVAEAANSIATIFCAGFSGGQPVMFAWLGFAGSGAASTRRPCLLASTALRSARPYRVVLGRASATAWPICQRAISERARCRVTESSASGEGMKPSGRRVRSCRIQRLNNRNRASSSSSVTAGGGSDEVMRLGPGESSPRSGEEHPQRTPPFRRPCSVPIGRRSADPLPG